MHAHPVMRAFVFIAEDYIAKRSLDLETSLPCPIGESNFHLLSLESLEPPKSLIFPRVIEKNGLSISRKS